MPGRGRAERFCTRLSLHGRRGGEPLPSSGIPGIAPRSMPASLGNLSAVTILVDPSPAAAPAADARAVALLRRAHQLGVTSLDVAAARNPERGERLLAKAFPEPDPTVVVIIGRSADSLSRERGQELAPTPSGSLADTLEKSIDQSRRRLAPVPIGVVEWETGPDEEHPALPRLEEGRGPSAGVPGPLWMLRLSSADQPLPALDREVNLFSGPFSILDSGLGSLFEAGGSSSKAFLIARDPFSEGRLDGSRFAARTALSGPASPPVDVRRLHQEFDPVLQLRFLTAAHRRTLAQAALQFVLHWSWVASTVVPLPEPERFEEVLGFSSAPPLSEDELEQIQRLK